MLKKYFPTFGYYQYKAITLHILVAISLITFSIEYFVYSLIVFWFFMPLYIIIFHDWICHEYITPKNKFCQIFLLLIFYSQENTIKAKRNYHTWHHKNFMYPELDPASQKIKGASFIKYVSGLHTAITQNIPVIEFSFIEKDKFIQWCDDNYKKLWISYLIICLALLPIEFFVVFCIYLPWLIFVISNAHDYYFHGPNPGKDYNALSFIFFSQAWHVKHHESWIKDYYGPNIWRYLNPQLYYKKIFFN
jgi:hypothetical protein